MVSSKPLISIHYSNKRSLFCQEPEDGSTIAHCLLRKPLGDGGTSVQKPDTPDDYQKCLKVLSEGGDGPVSAEIRRVINARDKLDNTALHYATQMWPEAVVRHVLEMGANIGVENVYGEVPVNHILPETMEAHLNSFCLTSKGNVTNDNFEITARFDFLAPPPPPQGHGNGNAGEEAWRGGPRNGRMDVEDGGVKKVSVVISDGVNRHPFSQNVWPKKRVCEIILPNG